MNAIQAAAQAAHAAYCLDPTCEKGGYYTSDVAIVTAVIESLAGAGEPTEAQIDQACDAIAETTGENGRLILTDLIVPLLARSAALEAERDRALEAERHWLRLAREQATRAEAAEAKEERAQAWAHDHRKHYANVRDLDAALADPKDTSKNADAIRQIQELQPELRENMAALREARAEHPELFPPNVPPLFADPKERDA
jgi:uncharacterized membrane protein YdfJ with MMPL/SSD domain